MTFTWTKEAAPRWDADKQRLFGPVELAAVGLAPPGPGEPVADEWWRVADGHHVAGYGWLDTEWGDARITFFVAPGERGRGIGIFILEHLEAEAAARGLNYIYNLVPDTHPDGPWIKNWLSMHGFHEASRGQLRRQVETTPMGARAQASKAQTRRDVSIHPLCAELSASASGQGGGGPRISVSYRLEPWPGRSPGSGRRGNWTPGACLGLR